MTKCIIYYNKNNNGKKSKIIWLIKLKINKKFWNKACLIIKNISISSYLNIKKI